MPHYVVSSEGPISVKQVHRPDLPDWERPPGSPDIGLPEIPEPPRPPWEPGGGLPGVLPPLPSLPPREEWPPLPPWFGEHPGQPLPPHLPIPPSWGHPSVPLPPDPEIDELPEIWPPLPGGPGFPGLPDFGGKTLCLVTIHVSRHIHFVRWMVIDHETLKGKIQRALAWIKDKMPAGGLGRPPQRPGPA